MCDKVATGLQGAAGGHTDDEPRVQPEHEWGEEPEHEWGEEAAEQGPVYITDRGRPTHVLLTFAGYEELVGRHHVLDLLGEPTGVEDVRFTVPPSGDLAEPATFD